MQTPLSQTAVVVPIYNEGQVLQGVVTELLSTFPKVICVDDGGSDDSGTVAHRAGATVITHPLNLGQGAALQTGFEYVLNATDAQYVLTFDADGQHRVSDGVKMLNLAVENNAAIIFGSRFLEGKSSAPWFKRQVLHLAALVTRWRTGLRLTDAHNGLRLIRRDALEQIHLHQDRMAHASEIVNQLAATKLPWLEAPVNIDYTDYSRAKGQSLWNSVNILIDLLLH